MQEMGCFDTQQTLSLRPVSHTAADFLAAVGGLPPRPGPAQGSLCQVIASAPRAVWQIVPEYSVVCEPVPEAFQIIDMKAVTHKGSTRP
jgi:hypothetical protein